MNAYQFEQIARRLQKEHGKIQKGDEEPYTMFFMPMETNVLRVHRKHPEANDQRLMEAINLALHTISGRIEGNIPDLSAFENSENILYRDALLMAFDPFTNEEIAPLLEKRGMERFEEKSFRKNYYHVPILCLMRIQESVVFWHNFFGNDSYFRHCEDDLGDLIKDDKMHYTIPVGKEEYEEITGENLKEEDSIMVRKFR